MGKTDKKTDLKIEYIDVTKLKPYEKNARKHEEYDISQIAKSIEAYGFNDPIGIWGKDNQIVEGHGRLLAAKKLGMKEVPCIRLDDLTDEQRREYTIMHNKTAELSTWDFDMLEKELSELDFGEFDIDWNIETEKAPDEVVEDEPPEVDEISEPMCKRGDIWKLGNHRLMCGDSTLAEDVDMLMNGARADMLLTDPPYNVAYEGGTKDKLTIQNDNMSDGAFHEFLRVAFSRADSVMRDGAAFYIWHADSEGFNFRSACKCVGWKVRQCLIWVKNSIVLGRQDYQWKHEPCLYGWKDGAAHYFIDDRTQSTVWEFNKPARNGVHPTMKPIELMARAIGNSARRAEIVLDLFGGSGSTLIACEQMERKCYMMELDTKYCDVIIRRWEAFTGNKAEKIN